MIYKLKSREVEMKSADPAPEPEILQEVSDETFCSYLARQFVARKGFQLADIPEVQELVSSSDVVLARSNGYSLTILCMVDREKSPGAFFPLSVDQVRQIGEACLIYTGTIGRARLPVFIRILEIGPGATVRQQQRLQLFKRSSLTARVIPSAMIIDPAAGQAWNSEQGRFYRGGYQGFVEKMLATPREAVAPLAPPEIPIAPNPAEVIVEPATAEIPVAPGREEIAGVPGTAEIAVAPSAAEIPVAPMSLPVVTVALLAALLAVFAAELAFGIAAPANGFSQR